MKFVRPLLIAAGIVVTVGLASVALVLSPAIQRWTVLRAAGRMPGLKLEVATVSAGFSGVTLGGLRLERGGFNLKLDRLDADFSLFQVLIRRRLNISRLTASGVLVDASRLSRGRAGAAAAGAPAAAPGLLAGVVLPFELELAECHLEGRALLPGALEQPAVQADFKITGGGIAPGREGALLLVASWRNPVAEARVAALRFQVSLKATETAERTFSRISLTTVVDAEGGIFSEQNQLKITADLARGSGTENYSVSVDTLIQGAAENVLAVHAALLPGGTEYAGGWTVTARTAQLEPFFPGSALPDFNARGEGRITFDSATGGGGMQGRLQADASRLEAVNPGLRAIGPLKLQAQFDLAATGGMARLQQLDLRIDGDQPVLELQTARPVAINLKERRVQVGGTPGGDVMILKLLGLPLAWVRPFAPALDVSGSLITGQLSVSGETDRVVFRTAQPLQVSQLTVANRGGVLLAKAGVAAEVEAVLTAREFQAKLLGLTLRTPAGDTLTASADLLVPVGPNPAIAISAGFSADLPALLAPWLPLGRIKASGSADFTLADHKFELRQLSASLTDPGGMELLKAGTLHPFGFDFATRSATIGPTAGSAGKGAADLLRIAVGHIPLDRLLPGRPGARWGGVVEQGEFVLTADGGKVSVRAASPLKLAGVSFAQGDRPVLAALAVEAQPYLELGGQGSAAIQTGDVVVRTANGATLLSGKLETKRTAEAGWAGTLIFNAEIPALVAQPYFAGAPAVTEGRASGEIRAALGLVNQVEARLTVNGLVAADGKQTLPVANLSFRAVVQPDGGVSVQAPLLLDRAGQRSDLNLSLEMAPAAGGFDVDGKLTGEHVEWEDAVAILGVFLAGTASDQAPAGAVAEIGTMVPDKAAAWSGYNGQLTMDIKSITRGNEWSATGLRGFVGIEPAKVALQKLEAAFGEKGRLAAAGEMRFTGGAQPYRVTGDFSLTEFDAGKLFKALEPGKPPTVEGLFAVTGHGVGDGETPRRAFERTRGRFELASRQGIFRGLQRTGSKVSMTSKAVELGASVLGSIFGFENITKAAEKVAGQSYFVDQLAQSVGELSYDHLSARLIRDESLNVSLEDISLVSPEIRLIGKGVVTYRADLPLLEQPLNASFSVAARGKLEQLLGKLRLTDGNRDELGYASTREPVVVGGTLAKPDPTGFFIKLAAAKLTELLSPDN